MSEENVTQYLRVSVALYALLLLTTSLYGHWHMMKANSIKKTTVKGRLGGSDG